MDKTVVMEKKGGVGLIKINRPESMNALNTQVLVDLDDILEDVIKDDAIQVIIITGEGKAFVAGADISEMGGMGFDEGIRFGTKGKAVLMKLEGMSKPSIAAVNGFALGGGCELVMACDLIIASEKARFGQPEVSLGIIPGFSGTQRMPMLVGKQKAIELILTGDIITAEEAYRIGLVNKTVEHEKLMDEAFGLAERIMKNAPLAIKYANLSIKQGIDLNMADGNELEAEYCKLSFISKDKDEAMKAFVEKRKPVFTGV